MDCLSLLISTDLECSVAAKIMIEHLRHTAPQQGDGGAAHRVLPDLRSVGGRAELGDLVVHILQQRCSSRLHIDARPSRYLCSRPRLLVPISVFTHCNYTAAVLSEPAGT